MKTFSLTNLRELTTEEQMRLNGGNGSPCGSCSCRCECSCECDTKNPDASTEKCSFENKKHSMTVNVGKVVMRRRAEELGY